MKKYELTKPKEIEGVTLCRIKALSAFGNVKRGALGGFVESEDNLSHEGTCWIYGDAKVSGNARVFGNAWVYRNTRVFGNFKSLEVT